MIQKTFGVKYGSCHLAGETLGSLKQCSHGPRYIIKRLHLTYKNKQAIFLFTPILSFDIFKTVHFTADTCENGQEN